MDEKRFAKKSVGYWMTEKKFKRLNFGLFENLCRTSGIELVKLNFDEPLDGQGPFNVILHKITDQLTRTQDGSNTAIVQFQLFQQYIDNHPEMVIIDPIANVLRLLDRHKQYQYVKECDILDADYHYFIPSFTEFSTCDIEKNRLLIEENDLRYPIVCKPSMSHCHGSETSGLSNYISDREEMAIIFNERGLSDIEIPCVAQSFVNHNARLYKVFIIGSKYFTIQRPSVKNFYADDHQETIFFNSSDVSKSYSSSVLNQLEEVELERHPMIEPDPKKLDNLVSGIQKKFGLDLLGIDVIIENDTGRYAVIDINAFPGYDGVQEFFPILLELLQEKLLQSECLDVASKDSEITGSKSDLDTGLLPLADASLLSAFRDGCAENIRTIDIDGDEVLSQKAGLDATKKWYIYNGLCSSYPAPLKGTVTDNIQNGYTNHQ